ncbi:MAG: UDP-3-O-(3-hydroxymyristoyl)glucosamine N-acyltransferase [Methanomassiliicoccus sp.]|nr:UDP-3-O-(3-hydroxymyristoyl)glucosamine N-acyltransferase [Methanomassiliicoccus sp.]
MSTIALKDVLDAIRCEHSVIGERDVTADRPSPIDTADGRCITFCNKGGEIGRKLLMATAAGIVITEREHAGTCRDLASRTFIIVDDPRLAFARVVEAYFSTRWPVGVSGSAQVSPRATVGKGVYIGPLCDVRDDVVIGDDSRLEGSVTVHEGVRIGDRVIIRAGAVIGTDGFGFNRDPEGRLEKFPQIGGVVIGDDVEIGSNVCVARGTMSDTVIGRGTKIDNLVQVAHNVRIGEDCLITSMVWLGGSARIGDRCWLSPMVSVLNGIALGNDVMVAMGSSVIKDVAAGEYVAGNPARPTIRKR